MPAVDVIVRGTIVAHAVNPAVMYGLLEMSSHTALARPVSVVQATTAF